MIDEIQCALKSQSPIKTFVAIINMSSLQFSPKKPALLEANKMAFLKYVTGQKQPLHNYQQRSIFWDRQHLYNENLMLRTKLKEMSQVNTKTKTQLLQSEKQMFDLTARKTSNHTFRSLTKSTVSKERGSLIVKWKEEVANEQEHEKHELLMKKQIRKLKEQIHNLHAENVQLKKSMKYTRMSELQAQNKQLHEEILRMAKIAVDANRTNQQLYKSYMKQKEDMQNKLRKEAQARVQASRQLKRTKTQLQQANAKITKIRTDKKLLSQINYLQQQNSQLKDVLEINMKNNSELKETLQSYIKNNQLKDQSFNNQLVKLDYSASVLSDYPNNHYSVKNSPTKIGYPNDLTSLQLLTSKTSLQDFRSPQKLTNLKLQQKIAQAPHNEEQQQMRSLNTLQKSLNQANFERYKKQKQKQKQPSLKADDYQQQFEDIMQDL